MIAELDLTADELAVLSLDQLARLVRRHWPKPYFGAVPYLEAMETLESIEQDYGCDSGKSVVLYFLSNAQTWRGPAAKAVKAELKRRAGVK